MLRVYICYITNTVLFTLTCSDLPQNCICDIKPLTLRFVTSHFSQVRYFFFCLRAAANTLLNNFASFSKSCIHKTIYFSYNGTFINGTKRSVILNILLPTAPHPFAKPCYYVDVIYAKAIVSLTFLDRI